MGFFDSKSSSETLAQNTGISDVGGIAQVLNIKGGGKRSTVAVNVLDAGAVAGGLGLGAAALESAERINTNSLDLFGGIVGGALDTTRTVVRDAIGASSDALQSFSNFSRAATQDAIAGFGALAKQSSASADDRVLKIGGYALAAIVAVMVLPQLFKGRAAS